MTDAARLERERGLLDAAAAAEMAAHIIKHLVGLHVGMGVGNLDRLGVCIEQPRREGADHEARRVESLLHGRRLVDGARDRLEVVGVEREGIGHAVPADDVERMARQDIARQPRAVLDEHRRLLVAVDDFNRGRPMQIALAEGRSKPQLAVGVEIAGGYADIAGRLDDEQVR
jgi:predicted Zn-dependent protease with MMP-like domain